LQANDPAYVDCRSVRGGGDIVVDLGNRIRRSRQNTYQLYSGHRGAGKSTELLRLQDALEKQGCFVVYFAAEEDIDTADVQYSDILLACARQLLRALGEAESEPLRVWLGNCWDELKELLLSEVSFEQLGISVQVQQFAKLTTGVKLQPTARAKIRKVIDRHTTQLINALNQFIASAKQGLGANPKLVVIVDDLDRILPLTQAHDRTSHEAIFVDRAQQLKGLDCHLIYTAPISLIYSEWANELKETYGRPGMLPMVMVRNPDGTAHGPGLAKMKALLEQRVSPHTDLPWETAVFDSPETVKRLCLMSGGHVRELMLLVQEAINQIDTLPISQRAVQRAITETRAIYQRMPSPQQWQLLAQVARGKAIDNEELYRGLLFHRCVLEYQYFDHQGEKHTWYDVHPLIEGIQQFQDVLREVEDGT
jgi:hypothetical protein